jgi:hypothetical protein
VSAELREESFSSILQEAFDISLVKLVMAVEQLDDLFNRGCSQEGMATRFL